MTARNWFDVHEFSRGGTKHKMTLDTKKEYFMTIMDERVVRCYYNREMEDGEFYQ